MGITARQIALDVLIRVSSTQSYSDVLLDSKFQNSSLSKADRSLAVEIVYGTLRWQKHLDWLLAWFYRGEWERLAAAIRCNLEMALYQIRFLDRVPSYAVVDEAVRMARQDGGERQAALVNGLLRNILRQKTLPEPPDVADDPAAAIAIRYSHPEWLVRRWIDAFGPERTIQICASNNERPSVGVRVNPLKATRESVLSVLESDGFDVEPSLLLDEMLVLSKSGEIAQTKLFRDGAISIQDVSAALVAHLIDPQPGEVILDVAAAPGGKSFHLAERSGGQARILSMDIHHTRLRKIRETGRRLGFDCVNTLVADGRALPVRTADKILIDAPCSGIGVIRRRPEIRWRMQESEITKLNQIQRDLLETSAEILKPGGVLVYSTCTVIPEENRLMVEAFCRSHPEFVKENAEEYVSDSVVADGFVETWPDVHGIDGSFASRLRKME